MEFYLIMNWIFRQDRPLVKSPFKFDSSPLIRVAKTAEVIYVIVFL